MVVLASVGSPLTVKNREDKLESEIIEKGKFYEVLYNLEKDMSRTEALAVVLEIRRQSYMMSDVVKFEYAEIASGSPQELKFQFKGLKSSGSPFIFTLAMAIGIILAAVTIAAVALIGFMALQGIWVIEAIAAPFLPKTVYRCKECGEKFNTYEGLVQHYADEHPGIYPPSEDDSKETEDPWLMWIILIAAVIAVIVIAYMLLRR